ncbi:MAG: hypothetical protein MJY74_02745 [Bacteroidaceae bacterium]|nr:hypothetical protein [Bacteroidaceae bacterium]
MKKLLLFLSVLSLQTYAQKGLDVVFVHDKEAKTIVGLDDLDKIVFKDSEIVYYLNDGTGNSIGLDKFAGFFVTASTYADKVDDTEDEISLADGLLRVNGHKNLIVKLYSAVSLVKEFTVESDSQTFDLSDLPRGVYIAVVGTDTVKLVK